MSGSDAADGIATALSLSMSIDEAYWRDIRLLGCEGFLTRRAMRYGAPIGAWLAMIAIISELASGSGWRPALLAAIYFIAGSVILVTLGARLEWRYLERRFGRYAS